MMYSLDRPSARVIGRIDDYGDDYDYDDDTIELELNEAAIRALTEAAALALAAFEERADPRLTPEANEQGTRGFEPEAPANERGPTALEHEAAAAGQAGEAFEQEMPAASLVAEALKQETSAAGQVAEAPKQQTPAARRVAEAFKQQTPAARQVSQALEQETPPARQVAEAVKVDTPAARQGTVSFARPPRKSRRFALGFGMAAALAGLLGGLAYLATAGARHPLPIVADSGSRQTVAPEVPTSAPTSVPASVPTSELAPASPVTPDVPVRYKNPFDASEVFEFPAGTSRAEMRDAVAELLSQRARERQSLFVKRPRRNTKSADGDASVTASRVTPRS
jgi:hypothetical protein